MKIAILTTYWKETQGTGVPRYIIKLVEEIERNKNYEVSVLYGNGNDPENYKITENKYIFPLKAIKRLNLFRPDIMYMETNWYFLFTSLLAKIFWNSKIITTVHSHPSQPPSTIEKCVMNYLLSKCDTITYVSKGLQEKIHESWKISPKVKEKVTYAGVISKSVTNLEMDNFRKEFEIKKDSIILLMQSSPIAKVKAEGTKILINAVKKLADYNPNFVLIITGNGPYLNELKEFAKNEDLDHSIIFTGWVDNPFIPLALCDIYTHISMGEGLPLAILEAMSLGKPIIATPVGGIPEVIDDKRNGLLVEPDADMVAQAINTLLNDEILMKTLGHNAYIDSKSYTWEKCGNTFIEIFEGRENSKW